MQPSKEQDLDPWILGQNHATITNCGVQDEWVTICW